MPAAVRRVAAAMLFAGLAPVVPAAASEVREPAGYRMEDYRAPVPAGLPGGVTVSVERVRALVETGDVVLIDVLPRPPRPEALPEDELWWPRPRYNIPGSTWLPNTGFGALSAASERYFLDNLKRLTAGRKQRTLLFYCLEDCWMSWNAAVRAIAHGYEDVLWFPDGTDGWEDAGLPTERSEPAPGWDPRRSRDGTTNGNGG